MRLKIRHCNYETMDLVGAAGEGKLVATFEFYNRPSIEAMNICFISGTPAGTGLPPVEGSS
jgi:hypothetical protein